MATRGKTTNLPDCGSELDRQLDDLDDLDDDDDFESLDDLGVFDELERLGGYSESTSVDDPPLED